MPPHHHHHHAPHNVEAASATAGRRLFATLGVTSTIMVAEVVGGILSGSLSLIADAGHMLTDLLAIGVALVALRMAQRPADARRTYGYRRFEVLAALFNGLSLFMVCGAIAVEGVQRLLQPQPVQADTMLKVAVVGLLANLVGLLLVGHGHENINMRGAFLHLVGDTLASVGVIAGSLIIKLTGAVWVDACISIGISMLVAVGAYRMLREVIEVLLESVPAGLDIAGIHRAMAQMPGVEEVFDLHVWSITHGMPALSAHVLATDVDGHLEPLLYAMQAMLKERFAIDHATLQIERRGAPHEVPSRCVAAVPAGAQRPGA